MSNKNKSEDYSRLIKNLSDLAIFEEGDVVSYYQEMLVLVAYDEVQGVDIGVEYPTFCKHLETNRMLRKAFDDTKDLLRATRPDISTPPADLSFLPTMPRISSSPAGRWEAVWSFTKDYLAEQFNPTASPLSPAVAHRDAQQAADDGETTIIHKAYKIVEREFQVWLRVASTLENGQLGFLPTVTVYDTAGKPIPEKLEVQLRWGAYEAAKLLPVSGLVTLPVIGETVIFDEQDQITAVLQLTLHQQ